MRMLFSLLVPALVASLGEFAAGGNVAENSDRSARGQQKITITHSMTIANSQTVDLDEGASPPGTPAPPQFDDYVPPVPSMPPSPPLPTGDDLGGHMGDACPDTMKDENGKFPDFCYDVLDEDGSCILDDVIATKEQCIDWFSEEVYNKIVETQRLLDEKRAKAKEAINQTNSTVAPIADDTENDEEKQEAIEAEGRSTDFKAASHKRAPRVVKDGRVVRRDGPVFNVGALGNWGNADTEETGPKDGSDGKVVRRDGPVFNVGALGNWDNADSAEETEPPTGYFQ